MRGHSSLLLVNHAVTYSPHGSCSESDVGADDDGSGSMGILEAYRALLAADFRPKRTIEFHWYAAEVPTAVSISSLPGPNSLYLVGSRIVRFSGGCASV